MNIFYSLLDSVYLRISASRPETVNVLLELLID